MKIKTNEASGVALDWLVAKCKGGFDLAPGPRMLAIYDIWDGSGVPSGRFRPSSDWSQGGPIIDQEIYELVRCQSGSRGVVFWEAARGFEDDADHARTIGPTPLVAAMRCYVASCLGDEVEIPDELA